MSKIDEIVSDLVEAFYLYQDELSDGCFVIVRTE